MDENDRQLALRVLRDTLRDTDAKPADRVRAAQLMLEAESAERAGPGALHDASDDELLRIARGQGGSPPQMGPRDSDASPVPSHAREVAHDDPRAIFAPANLSADRDPRPANPMMQRGPKKDPSPTAPPGGPAEGPKKDPPPTAPPGGTPPIAERGPKTDPPPAKRGRGRPKKDPQIASQIKIDDTPGTPAQPEPWE